MKCYSTILASAACVGLAAAFDDATYAGVFKAWMKDNAKVYGAAEADYRFAVFKKNSDFIAAHNGDGSATFKVGHNQFSDMTNEEFKATMMGLKNNPNFGMNEMMQKTAADPPASVDWRAKGAVTPVKNQGQVRGGVDLGGLHTANTVSPPVLFIFLTLCLALLSPPCPCSSADHAGRSALSAPSRAPPRSPPALCPTFLSSSWLTAPRLRATWAAAVASWTMLSSTPSISLSLSLSVSLSSSLSLSLSLYVYVYIYTFAFN
jgi:hypothetical protein